MKNTAILMGIVGMLVIPVVSAVNFEVSINDMAGDVSNSDIDITKVWTTVEGDKLAFHIQVAGSINDAYSYGVTASNGMTEIGAIYRNGVGDYAGTSSGGQPEVSVNGNTLTMKIPYGIVSSWNSFSINAVTHDNSGNTDWAASEGSNGGGNDNGGNENIPDPGNETPTDRGGGEKTPGFAIFSVAVALGIGMMALKRRK